METVARLFLCADCRMQVRVCSHCDRGQRYCCNACSQLARREAVRAAGRRYQSGRQGRLKHAERMRRYRARKKIVTHHGSPAPASDVLLISDPVVSATPVPAAGIASAAPARRCHFCGRSCSQFVRLGFLCGRPVQTPPCTGVRRRGGCNGDPP